MKRSKNLLSYRLKRIGRNSKPFLIRWIIKSSPQSPRISSMSCRQMFRIQLNRLSSTKSMKTKMMRRKLTSHKFRLRQLQPCLNLPKKLLHLPKARKECHQRVLAAQKLNQQRRKLLKFKGDDLSIFINIFITKTAIFFF